MNGRILKSALPVLLTACLFAIPAAAQEAASEDSAAVMPTSARSAGQPIRVQHLRPHDARSSGVPRSRSSTRRSISRTRRRPISSAPRR